VHSHDEKFYSTWYCPDQRGANRAATKEETVIPRKVESERTVVSTQRRETEISPVPWMPRGAGKSGHPMAGTHVCMPPPPTPPQRRLIHIRRIYGLLLCAWMEGILMYHYRYRDFDCQRSLRFPHRVIRVGSRCLPSGPSQAPGATRVNPSLGLFPRPPRNLDLDDNQGLVKKRSRDRTSTRGQRAACPK